MVFKTLHTCLGARRHDDDIMIFSLEWESFILAIILATLNVELESLGFYTLCKFLKSCHIKGNYNIFSIIPECRDQGK